LDYFCTAEEGEVRVSITAVWALSRVVVAVGRAASAVVMRVFVAAVMLPAQSSKFR
jgi:hypothetical protein